MLKRIFRSRPVQQPLSWLLAAYMALAARTTRWRVVGLDRIEPVWASGRGLVGCVWHGRALMTIAGWPKTVQPAAIVISHSPDGQFVADAARHLGVGVIRGSTRSARKRKEKGGEGAYRAMIRHVESGGCLAITPDGPRGPRMRASMGAARLARSAQAPVMLYGWSTRWRIVLGSWDRGVLPLPFGRGVIVWRGPLDPPSPDAGEHEMEAMRAAIEHELTEATQEADRLAGAPPVEPAAP